MSGDPGADVRRQAYRLDWCCIGVQKAGTSTLYRLLRGHPDIAIPPSKEDPIFDYDVTAEQVHDYLHDRFADAGTARCGTVTPQYTSDPSTAARLHEHFPDARIVAMVRDPVARAYSHYSMSVLRQIESRSFEEAVAAQLAALRAEEPYDPASETDTYVVRGRYSWLLADWFRLFGDDRVMTVFSHDLDHATVATIQQVETFLGVEPLRPDEADFRFNASPPPHRFSAWRRPMGEGLRRLGWNRVHPERRERISAFVERSLARVAPTDGQRLAPGTVRALRDYYAPMDRELSQMLGRPVPWAS